MHVFELPPVSIVNKVVPKNSFEEYATPKQRKLFSQGVSKITWQNKLSKDTINLIGVEVVEIQIFLIELKSKLDLESVFLLMDKAIPYHLIFVTQFENELQFRASAKHPHPVNPNNSVVDWTFKSEWLPRSEHSFRLYLGGSLDRIFFDFCSQLSAFEPDRVSSLSELVALKSSLHKLEKEIANLKSAIQNSKEFKKKVELNLQLLEKEKELSELKRQKLVEKTEQE
jgi:hypothetical protein